MMMLAEAVLAIEVRPVRDRPAQRAVERLLRLWVSYMHAEAKPAGYPRKACGGVTNYTSMDLDNIAAFENLDRVLAEKTDAVIASLTPVEQCAIHHEYLHAVFRFQREAFDVALERARNKIEIGLRARDVWLGD